MRKRKTSIISKGTTIPVVLASLTLPLQAVENDNNLTWSVTGSLQESYDDNVYMQDVATDPSVKDLDSQGSFVTAITFGGAMGWTPTDAFNLSLSVNPKATLYHQESDEDNLWVPVKLNLNGKNDNFSYKMANTFIQIEGDDEGLQWLNNAGGATAIGGVPVRNRRDAAIYISTLELRWDLNDLFFLRPAARFYKHDFQTKHYGDRPSYLNYVDRWEANGGLDFGYKINEGFAITLGYRFGHQDQSELLGDPTEYSNDYHRILLGVEGKPLDWLTVKSVIGPDFRDFTGDYRETGSAKTDGSSTRLYYDSSISITPTAQDTITIAAKQYMQPSFGGRNAYEDITWSLDYKRKMLDNKLTAGAGFRAYTGDFYQVNRDDTIYTISALLAYQFTSQLGMELSYTYDWSENNIQYKYSGGDGYDGREFTRNMIALGTTYKFK